MLGRLLHSILIGAAVAVLLLVMFPSLRLESGAFFAHHSISLSSNKPMSFYSAVKQASPAVVNVYSGNLNNNENSLEIRTLGSGVIMNSKGYILTNQHVIAHANQIIVILQDGRSFQAQLVGSDVLTDLAVLKIQANHLPYIKINMQRIPHVGDIVLAIGNPYNIGQTITQGIISAVGRNGLSPSGRQHFLQTDASINHGNSGGALINSLGELVGINTLSLDKSNSGDTPEGIGFAIPTALATKVMQKIIRDGRVIRGFIGIEGREIIPFPSNGVSSTDKPQGILVTAVNPGGPAALAGIKPHDVILKVNNKPVTSAAETMDQIAEIQPNTKIPVELLRNGKVLNKEVIIMEYPDINE